MSLKSESSPPDGGWGYIIAVGASLLGISTAATMQVFGLIYDQFLEQFGDVASSTTILNTIFGVMCSAAGLLTVPLSTKFSLRKIGICGAIFYSVGAFFCIFIQNFTQFFIAFSILEGIGFGLMLPISLTSINDYFLKRRPFINNFYQSVICAVGTFIPVVFERSLEIYGFRGTVALLAALSFHTILAMIVMQPVEWHMQYVGTKLKTDDIEMSNTNIKLSDIPFMDEGNNSNGRNEGIIKVNENESKSFWSKIIASFDFNMLMDTKYLNLSIGLGLSFSADNVFLMLTPMFLFHLNYEPSEAAYCITVAAVADLISRLLLSALSSIVFIKSRNIVLFGTICSVFLRYCISTNIIQTMIVFAGVGFARALIQTPVPLCFAEQYRNDQFTTAWGLSMLVGGTLNLIIGAVISVVAKIFVDDIVVIHTLSIITLLCIVPWIVEMFFNKK